jgi:hypothetical protein
MDDNQSIAEHYTHGLLERAIFEALSAAGKDLDRLVPLHRGCDQLARSA